MREVRRKKERGKRAGFSGRREDQEKEEASRPMVYSGYPRNEWALKEQKEDQGVEALLFSPPLFNYHLFQPITRPRSRKEAWLLQAWFTWETQSRFWEIRSCYWEMASCMEEEGQEEQLQERVEGRSRARCLPSSTEEEEGEVEVVADRRGKEEVLKRNPSPCYG